MSDKVIVTKNKLDTLANSISEKSGVSTPMTLNEMKTAVDSITTGGGSGGTDTSDATLISGSQMLSGVTAYSKGAKYTGTIATKTSSDLTVSNANVLIPAGYYASDTQGTVASGSTTPPANISGTSATVSSSVDSISLAKTISVTPQVSAGYVSEGTMGNVAVTLSAFVSTRQAQTITPGTMDQVIPASTYCRGAQTIEGDINLISENIVSGKTIFGVEGTASVGEDTLVEALHNNVTDVEDDTLTSIRSYGLAYMTALTSVDFPNLQTINSYAFYNDYNLVMNGWIFPKAKTIGNYAFRYCYKLSGDVVLPSTVTSIGQYSFASCENMETFTATGAITTLGTYTFNGASGHVMTVREIHLPNLGTSIALNLNFGSATAANACQQLELVDIGKAKSIAANTFANCYALQTLIMRRTSVTTLANVSAFLNTPIRGRNSLTAKIYVPEALIDDYKAATNWKTIDGYGFVEWCAIEGSEYEL